MDNFLVFVYGTLKRGFPNSQHMPSSISYVGTARTKVSFPLVVDSEMGVPYLLSLPNHPGAHSVHGELYIVDKEALISLDHFEGLDSGFYVRDTVEVVSLSDASGSLTSPKSMVSEFFPGSVHDAQAYFRSPSNAGPDWAHRWTVERLQTLTMLEQYTPEHAKQFRPRTVR